MLNHRLGDEENGELLAQDLRRTTPGLPIVFLSEELGFQSKDASMPVLRKPVSPAELRTAVNRSLLKPLAVSHQQTKALLGGYPRNGVGKGTGNHVLRNSEERGNAGC